MLDTTEVTGSSLTPAVTTPDPAPLFGPTDFEAWLALREARLVASHASGKKHLNQLPLYVESMRGCRIRYVHDDAEWGIVYTVSTSREVAVLWLDEHSMKKNSIGLTSFTTSHGRKLGSGSWLMPSDLQDYIVETGPRDLAVAIATDKKGLLPRKRQPRKAKQNGNCR